MTTEVRVRRAVVDDASGFVRAHELAWDAAMAPLVGKQLAELASLEDRIARYRAGVEEAPAGTGGWVAEQGDLIVGVAVRSGSELRDLYVVPDAWGSGVGRALMQAALDDIRADGGSEALLWVGEANRRARRFYEREGWAPTGQARPSVLGPREVQYRLSFGSSRMTGVRRSQPPP